MLGISRFLGIEIFMYFNEYNSPYFHVEYDNNSLAVKFREWCYI
jgi:hypothetical protein